MPDEVLLPVMLNSDKPRKTLRLIMSGMEAKIDRVLYYFDRSKRCSTGYSDTQLIC